MGKDILAKLDELVQLTSLNNLSKLRDDEKKKNTVLWY